MVLTTRQRALAASEFHYAHRVCRSWQREYVDEALCGLAASWTGYGTFHGYVRGYLKRRCIDLLRSEQHRKNSAGWLAEVPVPLRDEWRNASTAPGPADTTVEREVLRDALDLLDDVDPRLREVVVCADVNGEMLAAVADRLGVTESRVCQLRHLAHAFLRQYLSPGT